MAHYHNMGLIFVPAERFPGGVRCAASGQQMFYVAKAKRQLQDVGHKGVVTGCDAFSLCSP